MKSKKIGHKNKLVIWHEPFGLIDYLSLQLIQNALFLIAEQFKKMQQY